MEFLKKALHNNELTDLLVGKGDYFFEDHDYPMQPTLFSHVWETQIIPYQNELKTQLPFELMVSLKELLDYKEDINLGLYVFLAVAKEYFYYLNIEKKLTFTLDFNQLIPEVKKVLSVNKESLMKDKRWAGADWNIKGNLGMDFGECG